MTWRGIVASPCPLLYAAWDTCAVVRIARPRQLATARGIVLLRLSPAQFD
jgi:hypothetical protein